MANYKRVFLDGYSYYITIVTHRRNPILLDNIDLLRQSFAYAKCRFAFSIDEIVILPDHLHMIVTPKSAEAYPKIISTIKRYFSKHLDRRYIEYIKQSGAREKKGYMPVWQRRYYEHTIRDENDLIECKEYMYINPVKHGYVSDANVWRYGSFYRRCDRVTRSEHQT